jgi:AAA+ ATPase superfamily predicted ATPase
MIDWKNVFEEVKKDLNNYFEIVFEDFARELLIEKLKEGKISFTKIEKFFGYYREKNERKKFEIDIVCIDEKNDELLFFEVKWKDLREKEVEEILKDMERKTSYIQKKKAYGIIAKKIENKEKFIKKGYKLFDLIDL